MKFKVDKKEIYPALSIMTKLPMSKKSRLMEKDSLYIEVKDGNAHVISYDGYEIYIEVVIPIENDYYEEGISRFEAKLLGNIIKSLNGTVFIEDTKSRCIIVNNRTRFEIRSSAISENLKVMNIAKVEDIYKSYKIKQCVLKDSLESAMISMGKDIKQVELMNILMELDTDCVRFISTDGYRMSVIEESYVEGGMVEREDILLPSASIPLINSFLKKEGEVELRVNKEAVCFIFNNVKLHVRRNNKVQYPNVRQILEREDGNRVRIERKALLMAIDQFKATGADIVTLKSGVEGLKVLGNGEWFNDRVLGGEVSMDIEKERAVKMAISFRGTQLREGLKIINSEKIDITVKGEEDFIVMRPNKETDKKILYLVLPCMLYK